MNASALSALKYIQKNKQLVCKINDLNLSSHEIIITDGYNIEVLDPLEITNTFLIINFSSINYVSNIKFSPR